jgi:hypothetical protein
MNKNQNKNNARARAGVVRIQVRLSHRTYTVLVLVDGVLDSKTTCQHWEVSGVRNRLCDYWSGIADDVEAEGILPTDLVLPRNRQHRRAV